MGLPTNIDQTFGQALRAARESIGPVRFTQEAMGRAVACVLREMGHRITKSDDAIRRWERGEHKPEPHQVLACCLVLRKRGCREDEVLRLLMLSWPLHIPAIIDLTKGQPQTSNNNQNAGSVTLTSEPFGGMEPAFEAWMKECNRLTKEGDEYDLQGAIFCARQAIRLAKSDLEWERAEHTLAIVRCLNSEYSAAIEGHDRIISKFENSLDIERSVLACRASVFKAGNLWDCGRHDDALVIFDDIVKRYAGATSPTLKQLVLVAISNKANCLLNAGRKAEAIATFDKLINYPEITAGSAATNALISRARILAEDGAHFEVVAMLDRIVGCYPEETEEIAIELEHALLLKADSLFELGQEEEAIAIYNKLVDFPHKNRHLGSYPRAYLLYLLACRLIKIGRARDCLPVFSAIVATEGAWPDIVRFAKEAREEVQQLLAEGEVESIVGKPVRLQRKRGLRKGCKSKNSRRLKSKRRD